MPTYDYQCGACGHRYEVFQRMSDGPKRTCPKCKGRVRRLIGTGAGLLFKGSGFYGTDYRSTGYRKDAKADTAPPVAPAKGGDAATKAKPEAPSKKAAPAAGEA